MTRHRGLVITLVIAMLLGGAFIGVLAVVGDDPAPRLTTRGLTYDVVNAQEDFPSHPFLNSGFEVGISEVIGNKFCC